jgi:hypothetical protein
MFTAKSVVRRDRAGFARRDEEAIPGAPIARRSSLPANERQTGRGQRTSTQGPRRPAQPDILDEDESFTIRTTDDVVTDDASVRTTQGTKVMPLRTRRSILPEHQSISRIKVTLALVALAVVIWCIVWGILSFIGFCTDVWNTYHYGPTRTSVVSGVFGIDNDSQADPTSVIAMNVNGILVLEVLPAGDVSQMKVYPTSLKLVGDNAAKLPIRLKIEDVHGNHRPDVLIEIPGQSIPLKLINTGNGFTLTK